MRKDNLLKIFSNIPTIRTKRLILRRISMGDAKDMFEYSSDPQVSEYLLWRPHQSLEYTRDHISYISKEYRIGRFFDWGIECNEGEYKGKFIGTCGFTSFDLKNNSAEVGYVLNRNFWNHGYASEALSMVIEFGFDKLLLHRIEAKYIVGNDKSRRVMEKCNMTYEGTYRSSMNVKGNYVDIGICSIISDEYLNIKNEVLKQGWQDADKGCNV